MREEKERKLEWKWRENFFPGYTRLKKYNYVRQWEKTKQQDFFWILTMENNRNN